MHTAIQPQIPDPKPAPIGDVDALLVSARLLQQATPASEIRRLLRGKNIGLVCASDDAPDAIFFHRAASELGASVSHIRPGVPAGNRLLPTARVLGRLYDAIECQGLAPSLVYQLGRDAGVPVFDGLARDDHPTAPLARLLDGDDSPERKRLLILQAMLLFALR